MRLLRRYSLVWFTLVLWLVLWALYAFLEWKVGQYPSQDDVPWGLEWLRGTVENDQSEVFQGFYYLVATIFGVALGSAESRDSDERIEAKVDAALVKLGVNPIEIEHSLPEKFRRD
jgi:hypothetical protein